MIFAIVFCRFSQMERGGDLRMNCMVKNSPSRDWIYDPQQKFYSIQKKLTKGKIIGKFIKRQGIYCLLINYGYFVSDSNRNKEERGVSKNVPSIWNVICLITEPVNFWSLYCVSGYISIIIVKKV